MVETCILAPYQPWASRPLCKNIYFFVLSKPLLISVLFSLFVLPLRAEHNNIFWGVVITVTLKTADNLLFGQWPQAGTWLLFRKSSQAYKIVFFFHQLSLPSKEIHRPHCTFGLSLPGTDSGKSLICTGHIYLLGGVNMGRVAVHSWPQPLGSVYLEMMGIHC